MCIPGRSVGAAGRNNRGPGGYGAVYGAGNVKIFLQEKLKRTEKLTDNPSALR